MNVTEKLQSLINAANETTSGSAEDVTEAMQDLVDGYGGTPPSGTITITENDTYDVTEYASAIVNVEGEADQLLGYIKNQNNAFDGVTLPQKVVCEFQNLVTGQSMFANTSGVEEMDIVLPPHIALNAFLQNCSSIKKLKIRPSPYKPTNIYSFMNSANQLEEIDCEFDLSEATFRNYAFRGDKLKTVGIVPNSISVAEGYVLSATAGEAVLIAVANGLNIDVPSTFRVNPTNHTRMDSIMGNVVNNLFVANESGTTSLSDFITNTKGWTMVNE